MPTQPGQQPKPPAQNTVREEASLAVRSEPTTIASFNPQNFWPKDWSEGQRYAELLAKAPSMLPKHIRESKEPMAEVFATIMFGFEIGLAPLQALRAIYIVHGRASLYAADQIALVQRHPDCEKLDVDTDAKGNLLSDAKSCTWVTKRRGRAQQRLTFTMAEAEAEGLVAGNAKYKTSPAVMLRWRCATRLLSFTWGDVLRGLEDKEVVEAEEKDGGWAQRTTPPPSPSVAPPPFIQAPFPPHDPDTGEVTEEAPPTEAEVVDELAFSYLVKHIEAATSKEDLAARSTLVQKSKQAGKLTPDEEGRLLEVYKARRTVLAGGNGAGK